MSVVNNNLLLTADAAAPSAYQISRSLRFNSADSAYANRTFGTPTTQGTFTLTMWVKRSVLSTAQSFFGVSTNHSFGFTTGNALNLTFGGTSALTTTAVFRDTSAWYHIVWTQSGTSHTVYVNGTSQGTATATSSVFNTAVAHQLGASNTANYFNGYLADVHFIDGQALTPSSFTETNATTGQLVPKAYTGTYGTNGFRLNFSDNSAATAATLGADGSGNGNNWTPNNLSVTAGSGNDSLTDTPTSYGTDTGAGGEVRGNYATLNPVQSSASNLSNGNLAIAQTVNAWISGFSTIGINTGKWFWEVTWTSGTNTLNGIAANPLPATYIGSNSTSLGLASDAVYYKSGATTSYGTSFSVGAVIGHALDVNAGTIVYYVNGVSQGSITYGFTGTIFPAISVYGTTSENINFGQRPFAYAAPSGFKALCDANLPTPTIAKGSSVFDTLLWTGNGAVRSITGLNYSPDFVWIKGRSRASSNSFLFDTVRGATNRICSSLTIAEASEPNTLTSFNSDGFSLGTDAGVGACNLSGDTWVGWTWDAGSSTVTNTAGTISSQVRANASAGFSVVTYTGNGTAGASIGHGLGVAPSLVMVKVRSTADIWVVHHNSFANIANDYLSLNSTAAVATVSTWFAKSSSILTYTTPYNGTNLNGGTFVAYCFAPVTGYSAFGSYTGNGSADGPFVYLGFRPAFLMMKRTNSTGNWVMLDNKREGYNVDNDPLYANLASVEGTDDLADITSNGFKLRSTNADVNASGGTYVYACFAENPFQYSRAR